MQLRNELATRPKLEVTLLSRGYSLYRDWRELNPELTVTTTSRHSAINFSCTECDIIVFLGYTLTCPAAKAVAGML